MLLLTIRSILLLVFLDLVERETPFWIHSEVTDHFFDGLAMAVLHGELASNRQFCSGEEMGKMETDDG